MADFRQARAAAVEWWMHYEHCTPGHDEAGNACAYIRLTTIETGAHSLLRWSCAAALPNLALAIVLACSLLEDWDQTLSEAGPAFIAFCFVFVAFGLVASYFAVRWAFRFDGLASTFRRADILGPDDDFDADFKPEPEAIEVEAMSFTSFEDHVADSKGRAA